MKVLWFSLTPCNGASYLANKDVICGWLQSLESELKDSENIELSVCFVHHKKMASFYFEGVQYYPVTRNWDGNLFKKWLKMWFWSTPKVDDPLVAEFLQVVHQVQPDLIHIHGTEECFGLIQDKVSVPVVISIQGILAPYREKLFSGISYAAIKKDQSFFSYLRLSNIQHRKRLFDRTVKREKMMLSNAGYVIGRTAWDERVMCVLAPKAEYFTGNELLRDSFYKVQWNPNTKNKKFTIISVISGGYYKGLEMVYKTAKILTKSGFNFEWQVVGLEANNDFVHLVEKIERLTATNLPIVYKGRKDEHALSTLLVNADCYCQVSHIENSPNSLCEAMLVGMPIIASFVGGTDSLIEAGKSGILIQDGDSYSCAGSILEVSHNIDNAILMGENARKSAMHRHDKNKVGTEYLNIYSKVTLK